jgi:hypothetical protein
MDEVAHVWAQQSQDYGKSGNLHFEGQTIYSYKWYWIGYFVDPNTVLIQENSYSSTTAQHISRVRGAVFHKRVYVVPTKDDHKTNAEWLADQLRQAKAKLLRKRTGIGFAESRYLDQQALFNNYCKQFDQHPNTEGICLTKEDRDKIEANSQRAIYLIEHYDELKPQREKARQKREEAKRKKEAQNIQEWKKGNPLTRTVNRYRYTIPIALRIHRDEVESTWGARVPIHQAKLLYKAILAHKDVVGQTIAYYTVNSVDDQFLTIGCHKIPMTEVHEIGGQLLNQHIA